jgi:hypothetical protein
MYTTDKGTILPHPVYKEIRETMKTIHVMWKDLDLAFSFAGKANPVKKDGAEIDYEKGDPTYYKRMIADGSGSQKGIIR